MSLFDWLEVLGDVPGIFDWLSKRKDDRPARRRAIDRQAKTERRERHRLFRRPERGLNEND
ncbi:MULTISPECIES: hypothetical protein [unclassified Sphingomonas]|uniref:hypothetical protein n=1 Tax=unclassified Sphingomonas TaxID=196159 RepID=UPI000A7E6981|nr:MULTISPECIES: hypothetical protein [unclassified Sphingomonas]